jgi:hypothetical protein
MVNKQPPGFRILNTAAYNRGFRRARQVNDGRRGDGRVERAGQIVGKLASSRVVVVIREVLAETRHALAPMAIIGLDRSSPMAVALGKRSSTASANAP